MDAIISILPQPYHHRVQEIWQYLQEKHGLKGVLRTPIPHFSWQGAQNYNPEGARLTLAAIALATKPFSIQTSGIGLFTGDQPVMFIQVIKSPQLLRLHQQVWAATRLIGQEFNPYYAPDRWQPHITLALGDLSQAGIAPIMQDLAHQNFNWTFQVDHFAFYQELNEEPGSIIFQEDFKAA